MKKNARRKGGSGQRQGRRGKSGGRQGQGIRIHWRGMRPMYDFWGHEIRRYYKLDTLATAMELHLSTRDRFIGQTFRRRLGPSPLFSINFELIQEGARQHVFKVTAINAKRKQATLCLVVSKNAEEHSRTARSEHANLATLHARAPSHVVEPFAGGNIYLPDRYKRKGQDREIYVYLTKWLGAYHELGIGRDRQFFMNIVRPQVFTKAQTEDIKGKIIEVMARTYDPVSRTCMAPPELASGDLVVAKPQGGRVGVKLVACRKILRRVTPAKAVHIFAAAKWNWAGHDFNLAPDNPATLFQALQRALGKESAGQWLAAYGHSIRAGRLAPCDHLPLDYIDEISRG